MPEESTITYYIAVIIIFDPGSYVARQPPKFCVAKYLLEFLAKIQYFLSYKTTILISPI